jgi:hypothetical protein
MSQSVDQGQLLDGYEVVLESSGGLKHPCWVLDIVLVPADEGCLVSVVGSEFFDDPGEVAFFHSVTG